MAGVAVVGYDPSWPELFAAERADLEQALVPWLSGGIHHVGSTAIPGLAAITVLSTLGYVADSHLPRLDSANPAAWLTLAAARESPVSIVVIPVALLALYGVIRLAVRHGVEDAWRRRRQLDETAAETEQFGPRPM